MARVYREAPLNSVWEGTANMMCMDVRRAMMKDARTMEALFQDVEALAGHDRRFDAMVHQSKALVLKAMDDEFYARPMTEAIARLLQAGELLRHSTNEVADLYLATRGGSNFGNWGSNYGTLGPQASSYATAKSIMERAMVVA